MINHQELARHVLKYTLIIALAISSQCAIASDTTVTEDTDKPQTVPNPGIVLTISTDKKIYDPDDPIYLFVTIRNESKFRLDHSFKNWGDPKRLIVTWNRQVNGTIPGIPVKLTAYSDASQNIENFGGSNMGGPNIDPGMQEQECFLLNRFRDTTVWGYYEVTVMDTEHIRSSPEGWTSLTSNTQSFTVRESDRLPPGVTRNMESKISPWSK